MTSKVQCGCALLVALLAGCSTASNEPPGPGDAAPDVETGAPEVGDASDGANPHAADAHEEPRPCWFPEAPPQPYALTRRFPDLVGLEEPVGMARAPGVDGWWYVIGRQGQLWRFEDSGDAAALELVLDLTPVVDASGDSGLLGVAFHPSFQSNGFVYLSYTRLGGTVMLSRLSRFSSADGGATVDPASEVVLIEIDQTDPHKFHTNGAVAFGPDGLLYATFGDGGPDGDPEGHAQNPFSLRGKMVRLDVSGPEPQAIPADNPFAGGGGAPEVYALGLRNPWRWSVDPATGDIFAGDVGWSDREELTPIARGGNHGWPLLEGTVCHAADCDGLDTVPPLVEYGAEEGRSVTGGPIYRGGALPELTGQIIFGDFVTGYVWAATREGERTLLVDSGRAIVSFATAPDGEVLVVDMYESAIFQLVRGKGGAPLPDRLSDTGCVDAADPHQPAAHFVPYTVAWPLWSDGADKQRWLSVPDGAAGEWESDQLVLPAGTVLMKRFERSGVALETRLMVRHDSGEWAGYTYTWGSDQADATLEPLASRPVSHDIAGEVWQVPTRRQCLGCHTSPGPALGFSAAQLNLPTDGGSQPRDLAQAGVAAAPPPNLPPAMPGPGAAAGEEVRAWLHANCAHCHQPGTWVYTPLDLRYAQPLAATGLCGDGWSYGGPLLVPGDPDASGVVALVDLEETGRMPPIGVTIPDSEGIDRLRSWITSLDTCE